MRVFNADGTEAEMSGNGIRCAAAHVLAKNGKTDMLQLETAAGVKSIQPMRPRTGSTGRGDGVRDRTWVFRVSMGAPVVEPSRIPFKAGKLAPPIVGFPLNVGTDIVPVTVTSMGNPHCSVFVRNFEHVNWPELGRQIEIDKRFPNRTNIEFVRVISRRDIEVRYWERGVGKTQSSGTGSCAAVVACILNGLTDRTVRVHTLAGTLDVTWSKTVRKGQPAGVTLTGPAQLIAEGTYYF